MIAWEIVTMSPARLWPVVRVCYAADPFDAMNAVLRAYPDEVAYGTITESLVAGIPTDETWVGHPEDGQ